VSSSKTASGYHHGDLRRALVDAATAIVADDQNWEFSLREVARRAGVSHNAPYRHFPEKFDLLAAVAAEGFNALESAMTAAAEQATSPDAALLAIGRAYAQFGAANPARYRLMFGTALGPTRAGLPPVVGQAAAGSKAVLSSVLEEGVAKQCFVAPGDDANDYVFLTLAAWAVMHGLTMLLIDGLADAKPSPALFDRMGSALLNGIERP
jgi:AcrR family transcriptional regulator